MDYIDAHLCDPLDLFVLASVANSSPWHFHRLFRAAMGETIGERVRRRRVETAAALLLAAPRMAVQAVALESGFGAPEVLSRRFKAHFGVTPGAWREGAYRRWADARRWQLRAGQRGHFQPGDSIDAVCIRHADGGFPLQGELGMPVELKRLPARRVAYMRHVGPYGDPGITRLWQRFSSWDCAAGPTATSRLRLGVGHDSADIAMPQQCRYDACIEVADSFTPPRDVGTELIPGGLFACAQFSGASDGICDAWLRLTQRCTAERGCRPDARPCIEIYGDAAVLALPAGRFTCELCLPVRLG